MAWTFRFSTSSSLAKWGSNVAVAFAALLFLFHFLVTFVYLTPVNPVKLRFDSFIEGYIGSPLFQQNWHLFAPTPIARDASLLAMCRSGGENSDWIDLTTPLLPPQVGRFDSVAFATAGVQLNLVTSVMGWSGPWVEPVLEGYCSGDAAESDYCERMEKGREASMTSARNSLVWMVSRACRAMNGKQPEQVRLGVAVSVFPRFSERHRSVSADDMSFIDLGWEPAR